MTKVESIRQASETQARLWGLNPEIFQVVYEEGPANVGPKYALPKKEDQGKPWQAKYEGKTITLNAATIKPEQVPGKIRHEISHLVYAEASVQESLDKLFKSLPQKKRREIGLIIKKRYPPGEAREEAHAHAFEILTTGPKNFVEAFLAALDNAWNKITNKNSIPKSQQRDLTNSVLQIGIEKLQNREQELEPNL